MEEKDFGVFRFFIFLQLKKKIFLKVKDVYPEEIIQN